MNSRFLSLLLCMVVAACSGDRHATTDTRMADVQVNETARPHLLGDGSARKERASRAQMSKPSTKARGLTRVLNVPVAITTPTACDWTGPSSAWKDRSACGSQETAAGKHKVIPGGRILDLDTRVIDEVNDADAFGWGPRLLTRQGQPLIVGDDVYVTWKGGNYTPCDTVGPVDPCGPDLWDERIYGVRAYRWGGDNRLTLQWEHASTWVPPGINVLSQSWEPVFQPVIAGNYIYVPEGHGQIGKIDRATGITVATLTSPEATSLTYVAGPPAVTPEGVVYFTSFTLNSADPYTADNSWITRVAADGTKIVKNVNQVALNQPLRCRLFFSLASPRPAFPWPPAPGALAPTFLTGAYRFPVNATPAVSLDGTRVTVVARGRQCADASAVVQLEASTLNRVWETDLTGWLDTGCGPLRSPSNQPTHYLTPDTAPASDTSNNLDCRVGSTLGVDRLTGAVINGSVNELSVSTPIALPNGWIALGSYTNYNNEQGTTWIFDRNGAKWQTHNFGWNYQPAVIHSPADFDATKIVMIDNHYDNGPYSIIGHGLVDTLPKWAYTNTNDKSCTRSGDIYDCVVTPRPTAPGPGQVLKRVWKIINGYRTQDVSFVGSTHVMVPRSPLVTPAKNVWVSGSDGVARLLSGSTGALLDAVQVDSWLNQNDIPMSLDARGRVYIMQNAQLVVVGKN